jgi:hypothetical protein
LTPGQASYVLDRLVSERRIAPGEITRYVTDMHREISDLESRLASLKNAAAGGAPPRRGPGRPPGSGAFAGARRGPQSAAGTTTGRRRGRPPKSASAGAAPAQPAAPPPARGGRRRQKTPISAEQLASRQLQGRYLALIRQIPVSKRPQYQKIAKEKGREAAIAQMQDVVKK